MSHYAKIGQYSGTSLSGLSQVQKTSLERTAFLAQNAPYGELVQTYPLKQAPLYRGQF